MLSYFWSSNPTEEDFEIVEVIEETEQETKQEPFLLEIACLKAELDHKNKELEKLKKNTSVTHCKIVNDNKPFVYYLYSGFDACYSWYKENQK